MNLPASEFTSRLDRYRKKQFMYLARHQTPQTARTVLAADIPGVYGQREYKRFYPAGEVVSQLVGTTDIDGGEQLALNWSSIVSFRASPVKSALLKISTVRRLETLAWCRRPRMVSRFSSALICDSSTYSTESCCAL